MKKLLLLIVLFAFFFAGNAQQNQNLKVDGNSVNIDKLRKEFKLQTQQTKGDIGWIIPSWDMLDNYHMTYDYVTHYANVTFQDSVGSYESGGSVVSNWLCGIGGVLEPYSIIFDSNLLAPLVAPGTPYNVDSLMILGWYSKVNSTPDTLLVEVVTGTKRQAPAFAGVLWTYGNDSYYASPPMVTSDTALYGAKCLLSDPSKTVIKYVLTNTDSTNNFGKYITIPIGISVPADHVIGFSVVYVPGTTYGPSDILYSYSSSHPQTVNSLRVGLYAVDDPTANPHYFNDEITLTESLSHYINEKLRYQTYAGSDAWRNDRMGSLNSWGFDIGYYVTTNTGINDIANNNMKLYPNPSNGEVTIELQSAENASVAIFDIAGNIVLAKELNELTTTFNINNVEAGLYIVKVTQNGTTSAQKLMIK